MLSPNHNTKQIALNGLDIEMGSYTNGLNSGATFGYNDYYLAKPFLDAIKNDQIPITVLDDKVRRILRLEFRTNIAANYDFHIALEKGSYFPMQKFLKIFCKTSSEVIIPVICPRWCRHSRIS
jgi:hypothetical protein